MNRLLLNKKIFTKDSLVSGIEAFKRLCTIDLSESEDYYICDFLKCFYGVDETKKEFENYIIDLMNTSYDNN